MDIEHKWLSGKILETKQASRNGIPVGIMPGILTTWDVDEVNDQFIRGAFAKSIRDLKSRNRPLRFKDQHERVLGGFPPETLRETKRGLEGTAEVNLEIEQGRDLFSLARQGIISDFSVGWVTQKANFINGVRQISLAELFEASAVDEPQNKGAHILEVKAVVPFQDLPIGDQDRAWDATAAIQRVRVLTGSEDSPSRTYRNAFLWYDRENADNFGAYKLPIADVINGTLTAMPRGIFAAAGAVSGARGGLNIPDEDRPGVIRNINRYYDKMDLPSPLEDQKCYSADELRTMTKREIERAFRSSGVFTKSASKILIARMTWTENDPTGLSEILNDLKTMKKII